MEDKGSNKALGFLETTGLVQAYECNIYTDLLTSLCEHGLPTGDLYEFSALMVLKFEKKWKAKNRLNKPKAGQETSPVRKGEAHEQDQIKHEDKSGKAKEEKKPKEKFEDEKKGKKTKEEIKPEKNLKEKLEEKKQDKNQEKAHKEKFEEKKVEKNSKVEEKGHKDKIDEKKQDKKIEEKGNKEKLAVEDKKLGKEGKKK